MPLVGFRDMGFGGGRGWGMRGLGSIGGTRRVQASRRECGEGGTYKFGVFGDDLVRYVNET